MTSDFPVFPGEAPERPGDGAESATVVVVRAAQVTAWQ
jgi:hypothetical protein